VNLLLDTHVALWAITDSERLTGRARQLIQEPTSVIWVSVVSLWEIAIKHGLGRGDMPVSSQQALSYFKAAGYRILSLDATHVLALQDLPAHHQDPFDRMLVAQALTEPMRLMSHDAMVARYSDTVIRL
jgi:PIN domain nuclease of toxin-antitoxin system